MAETGQDFRNHRRIVPVFHFVVLPILGTNIVWSAWRAIQAPAWGSVFGVLLAVSLVMVALYARGFALAAQDRVIRLEMRLRLRELLPAELQRRILDFTPGQLVAMRFAPDAELPALAAAVLKDNIQDKNTIKKMITSWQGDYLRV